MGGGTHQGIPTTALLRSQRVRPKWQGQLQAVQECVSRLRCCHSYLECMPVKDQSALGCSKCRFSKRGCKRCRDPAFQKRQRESEPCGGPAKRQKRRHSRVTAAAASRSPVQKEEELHAAPQPAGKLAIVACLNANMFDVRAGNAQYWLVYEMFLPTCTFMTQSYRLSHKPAFLHQQQDTNKHTCCGSLICCLNVQIYKEAQQSRPFELLSTRSRQQSHSNRKSTSRHQKHHRQIAAQLLQDLLLFLQGQLQHNCNLPCVTTHPLMQLVQLHPQPPRQHSQTMLFLMRLTQQRRQSQSTMLHRSTPIPWRPLMHHMLITSMGHPVRGLPHPHRQDRKELHQTPAHLSF